MFAAKKEKINNKSVNAEQIFIHLSTPHIQTLLFPPETEASASSAVQEGEKQSKTVKISDKRELKGNSEIPNVVLHVKEEYFYLLRKITATKRKYPKS